MFERQSWQKTRACFCGTILRISGQVEIENY
jgi:hypothetical protein